MRDVIQKVVAAEAEAKRLVETARSEADRILSTAQREGRELLARAQEEAKDEAGRVVEAALVAAEEERKKRLARVAVELESQVRMDEATRERVIAEAIRCFCGQGNPPEEPLCHGQT